MTAATKAAFDEREAHLEQLVELNRKAGVDAAILGVVEAFARLKLRDGTPFDFYPDGTAAVPPPQSPEAVLLAQRNPDLEPRTRAFLTGYADEMARRGLPVFLNLAHLAHQLGISGSQLQRLRRSAAAYRRFTIPKRDGTRRAMAEPAPELKEAQRWIKARILSRVPLHPGVHGFRRKRSIATNARRHVGRAVIVRLDLESFFPNIASGRVRGIFLTLGFFREVADALTDLTTLDGGLPVGAPTSPVLSNIVARRMDYRFDNLGRKIGFSYTRYADDLTFSSNRRDLNRKIPFFREIIEAEGFKVNERKVWVFRREWRQLVTGLVVNDRASLVREEVRLVRAVLHNCRTGNLDAQRAAWAESRGRDPSDYSLGRFRASVRGKVALINMVSPVLGAKLGTELEQVPWPAGL